MYWFATEFFESRVIIMILAEPIRGSLAALQDSRFRDWEHSYAQGDDESTFLMRLLDKTI